MVLFLKFMFDKKCVFNKDFLKYQYLHKNLRGAHVFAELFKLNDETNFKNNNMIMDKDGDITLCKFFDIKIYEWFVFINFIKLDDVNNFIKDDNIKNDIDKLNEISNLFGGIPSIDKFYNNYMKKLNHKDSIYNPMTPEQDFKLKYNWTTCLIHRVNDDAENYEPTVIVSESNNSIYCRKLKEN